MFQLKVRYGIIAFLLLLSFILGSIIFHSRSSKNLKIVFLDVGQGDAILISQGSDQMLIDGGRDGKLLLNKLGKYIPFWDRNIEVIAATHPDQDHISGLIDVLKSYQVKTIIETEDQSQSQTYKRFREELDKEKIKNVEAKKGTEIKFSEGVLAEIIYPFSETGDIDDDKSNSGSVVIKLDFGENKFLLAGDLPREQEKEILNSDQDIDSTILKLAHHGSKYSTSPEFLEKITPDQAVISVGKDNSYGHPSPEIIDLLNDRKIEIIRTDENGDIVFECEKGKKCQILQ